MRTFFLLLLILCSSLLLPAQPREISPGELKELPVDIAIYSPLPAGCQFPFSSFNIIDSRADTSKIGFIKKYQDNRGKKLYRKMTVEGGLANGMETMLNKHYASCFSNDSLTLVIVLKRFWADPNPNRQLQRQGSINRESVFDMYLKLEFFLQKNNLYYPVKRTDTLFQTGEDEFIPGCTDRGMRACEIYGYAISKVLESIDFNYYAGRLEKQRNKITKGVLDSFNRRYNEYPVVNAPALTKGVYLTFDEFKNNRPSVSNYRIEKHKKNNRSIVTLFNTDITGSERIPKFWGYCDGAKVYCGYIQHPLFKAGNTFEFFIDKTLYDPVYVPVPMAGVPFGMSTVPVDLFAESFEPFQIDMETGKIF
jgi:hypothetical protein